MSLEMMGTGGARQFYPEQQALSPLVWRCCGCGKTEGEAPSGRYTDGICERCLRRLYPQFAERVLEQMRADGDLIRW